MFAQGWDSSIQMDIINHIYLPVKGIWWRLNTLRFGNNNVLMNEIMLRVQEVLSFFEEMALKSFSENGSDETKDLEDELEKSNDEEEESPKEKLHINMQIIKERVDFLNNEVKKIGIQRADVLWFSSEIRGFLEFIYSAMSIAKSKSPNIKGMRMALDMNIIPVMAERHMIREPRIPRRGAIPKIIIPAEAAI